MRWFFDFFLGNEPNFPSTIIVGIRANQTTHYLNFFKKKLWGGQSNNLVAKVQFCPNIKTILRSNRVLIFWSNECLN
jgi:hypothetical protein